MITTILVALTIALVVALPFALGMSKLRNTRLIADCTIQSRKVK